MSISTSTSIPISNLKAKELAERILAKANDKSAKFPNLKTISVCPSCLGTGMRYVYHYGKRLAKRCESAIWDKEKKKFICLGNPQSEMLEMANKKDLVNQIWKIVTSLKQKEYFLFWLQHEHKTQSLSCFPLQQLELILNQVKTQSILPSNQQYESQQAA